MRLARVSRPRQGGADEATAKKHSVVCRVNGTSSSATAKIGRFWGISSQIVSVQTTNNGHEVALEDMRLRGAGQLFGQRQSGPADTGLGALLTMTDLATDEDTLAAARQAAQELFAEQFGLAVRPQRPERVALLQRALDSGFRRIRNQCCSAPASRRASPDTARPDARRRIHYTDRPCRVLFLGQIDLGVGRAIDHERRLKVSANVFGSPESAITNVA